LFEGIEIHVDRGQKVNRWHAAAGKHRDLSEELLIGVLAGLIAHDFRDRYWQLDQASQNLLDRWP